MQQKNYNFPTQRTNKHTKIPVILFQGHLQMLFDWQVDLDKLNVRAQTLLETCADTRISNGITQITTKYNALLSLAKEVMKRLELHYQVTIVLNYVIYLKYNRCLISTWYSLVQY